MCFVEYNVVCRQVKKHLKCLLANKDRYYIYRQVIELHQRLRYITAVVYELIRSDQSSEYW